MPPWFSLSRFARMLGAFLVAALPSVIGCPVVPPASEWGSLNTGCLDQWSIAHFASGFALGETFDDDGLLPTEMALLAWELGEPHFWPGENTRNQVCDMFVGTAGWWVATRTKPREASPAAEHRLRHLP